MPGLTDEQWSLVLAALPDAERHAARRGDPDLAWEGGLDTLIRCALAWDPSIPVPGFRAYARAALRYSARSDRGGLQISDHVTPTAPPSVELDAVDLVQYVLTRLSERDAVVLILRFVAGWKLAAIGEVLGISANGAHEAILAARRRARELLRNGESTA